MEAEKIQLLLWRKPTIEVINWDKIGEISDSGIPLKHYIGYEVSGYLHIGSGIIAGLKIKDFQDAKIDTSVFLADWHAWINNKLGGDIDLIRKVARGYFKEAMKKSVEAVGGNPENIRFILASEIYNNDYWAEVIRIGKEMSLRRVMRSITIMGRKQSDSIPSAWLIYPLMQAADIIFQKINVAHAGIDQRKAHVIAIEYAHKIKYNLIAVHHQLITNMKLSWDIYQKIKENKDKLSIKEELSELKMSKSVPGSTILIHEDEEKIKEIIRSAFCPKGEIKFNPIWEMIEHIVFRKQENVGAIFVGEKLGIIDRKELGLPENVDGYDLIKIIEEENSENKLDWNKIYKKFENEYTDLFKLIYEPVEFEIINEKTGERKIYTELSDLRKDWIEGRIHPLDLKMALYKYLVELLKPIREYFKGPGKKYLDEIANIKITR